MEEEKEKEKKEENKKEKTIREEIKEEVEKQICYILQEGVQPSNYEALYELVDIHKDIENEEYWEIKKEVYKNELQLRRRF